MRDLLGDSSHLRQSQPEDGRVGFIGSRVFCRHKHIKANRQAPQRTTEQLPVYVRNNRQSIPLRETNQCRVHVRERLPAGERIEKRFDGIAGTAVSERIHGAPEAVLQDFRIAHIRFLEHLPLNSLPNPESVGFFFAWRKTVPKRGGDPTLPVNQRAVAIKAQPTRRRKRRRGHEAASGPDHKPLRIKEASGAINWPAGIRPAPPGPENSRCEPRCAAAR